MVIVLIIVMMVAVIKVVENVSMELFCLLVSFPWDLLRQTEGKVLFRRVMEPKTHFPCFLGVLFCS